MTEAPDFGEFVDVLGNDNARQILALASDQRVSAQEIADHLDVSLPTVYRSINSLVELGFLNEHPSIDEEGNQRKVFETSVRRISYGIEDGQYTVSLELNQEAADQLEGMGGELNETGKKGYDHNIELRSDGERTPTLR